MSELEFVLTLTIKGNSLQEVDDALMKAAGERLMARLVNPPKINGTPRTAAKDSQTEAAIKKQYHEKMAALEQVHHAIQAVKKLCGPKAAYEVFKAFGISDLNQLSSDQFEGFIQHCNSKIEDASKVGSDLPGEV